MNNDKYKMHEIKKFLYNRVFQYDLKYDNDNKDKSVEKSINDVIERISKMRTSSEIVDYVNLITGKGTISSIAFSEELKSKGIPRIEDVIDEFNTLFKIES